MVRVMKNKKLYEEMTTWELLRVYLMSKLPRAKKRIIREQEELNNPPENISINHLAVILDGNVEEVLRCQNRLAALLLSEPTFVEFNPEKEYPVIGLTKYIDGEFVTKQETNENLTEEKIEKLLEGLDDPNE